MTGSVHAALVRVTLVLLPPAGTSLLTLCFCPDTVASFYLCHVCKEKVSVATILAHVVSTEHNFNYFVRTQLVFLRSSFVVFGGCLNLCVLVLKRQTHEDPNVLPFAWFPAMDYRGLLMVALKKKSSSGSGLGKLQVCEAVCQL